MPEYFTFGYSRRSLDDLERRMRALNALLVDIRLVARSRRPEWDKGTLTDRLPYTYGHLPQLGNRNYNTDGPIAIADMEDGIHKLDDIQYRHQGKPIILLCQCPHLADCHRRVVADALRERGHSVEELHLPAMERHEFKKVAIP